MPQTNRCMLHWRIVGRKAASAFVKDRLMKHFYGLSPGFRRLLSKCASFKSKVVSFGCAKLEPPQQSSDGLLWDPGFTPACQLTARKATAMHHAGPLLHCAENELQLIALLFTAVVYSAVSRPQSWRPGLLRRPDGVYRDCITIHRSFYGYLGSGRALKLICVPR